MRTAQVVIIVASILLLCMGCSQSGNPLQFEVMPSLEANARDNNHWTWGYWTFYFSADHSEIEAVPQRNGNYHYCVTKFVETSPCSDCLLLGKPQVQPDGTVKLKVTLSHPFKLTPFYTGFDVRGMVYFPPTSNHMSEFANSSHFVHYSPGEKMYPNEYGIMPINFSRVDEGGGELLNADGYSTYLIPGINYSDDWLIFSYYPGKYGKEPTPELPTVNPYKLFASDSERRMFRVTDTITREYHLALPPGQFCFGYAVDASWCPPGTTPVTDPAEDFPMIANAEDPWLIEYEQLLPISEENIGKDIFKLTVHDRGTNQYKYWTATIYVWNFSSGPYYNPDQDQFFWGAKEVIDKFTLTGNCELDFWWYYEVGQACIPGHHLGVLIVFYNTTESEPEGCGLWRPCGVRFVDIYVE